MPTWVLHGAPGVGKTYFAEILSQTFFKKALLKINGAEYSMGDRQINKLIGSSVGTVGSEEQRSILTKFVRENPQGGLIVIEEADYLHSDIINFLTNMITDKKFSDGLGIEYDVSNFCHSIEYKYWPRAHDSWRRSANGLGTVSYQKRET